MAYDYETLYATHANALGDQDDHAPYASTLHSRASTTFRCWSRTADGSRLQVENPALVAVTVSDIEPDE